jgi:hypothetical protein
VTFEEIEEGLKVRLEAPPPAARAELLDVLQLTDLDRAQRVGEFSGRAGAVSPCASPNRRIDQRTGRVYAFACPLLAWRRRCGPVPRPSGPHS